LANIWKCQSVTFLGHGIQGGPKSKLQTFSISLPNIDRFSIFFHQQFPLSTFYGVLKYRNIIFMLISDALHSCMSLCLKRIPAALSDKASAISVDRYSTDCTSSRHKTGNYNGIPAFVKFVETDSLTLTRDDVLELELVRPHRTMYMLLLQCNFYRTMHNERCFHRKLSVCESVRL